MHVCVLLVHVHVRRQYLDYPLTIGMLTLERDYRRVSRLLHAHIQLAAKLPTVSLLLPKNITTSLQENGT